MPAPIAVVDTSAILLIVAPIATDDEVRKNRQTRATECFVEFQKDGATFIVPSLVVTELGMGSEGRGELIAQVLFARFGGMRVEAFDVIAAEIAAKALRTTFRERSPTQPRDVVKLDAMIVAVAVQWKASHLLTANPRDFRKHLDAVNATMDLVIVDATRQRGQLRFIDRK